MNEDRRQYGGTATFEFRRLHQKHDLAMVPRLERLWLDDEISDSQIIRCWIAADHIARHNTAKVKPLGAKENRKI